MFLNSVHCTLGCGNFVEISENLKALGQVISKLIILFVESYILCGSLPQSLAKFFKYSRVAYQK